jgi:transmembrane 9 superfamily protein 2/4
MRTLRTKRPLLLLALLLLLSCVPKSNSYYLPGTYPVEYPKGSVLNVEVNSLVSSDTEMPFDYYSMPFCRPEGGVKKSSRSINPGTIMLGMRIENSPYELRMREEEYAKSACGGEAYKKGTYTSLTKQEAKELKEKIKEVRTVPYYIVPCGFVAWVVVVVVVIVVSI